MLKSILPSILQTATATIQVQDGLNEDGTPHIVTTIVTKGIFENKSKTKYNADNKTTLKVSTFSFEGIYDIKEGKVIIDGMEYIIVGVEVSKHLFTQIITLELI